MSTGTLLAALANNLPGTQIFDTYVVPPESLVTFTCEKKKLSVTAMVVDPFQFSINSKWDGKALGSLGDTSLLKGADALAQRLGGVSINQPILARRTWSGTDPFETTLKIRFVAQELAQTEVYDQVVNLVNMLLPRALYNAGAATGIVGLFAIPGPAPFTADADVEFFKKIDPEWSSDENNTTGDNVSIKYGELLALKYAYLTKVQGSFSRTLDPQGYPLAAEVYVSFGAMDSPFYIAGQANNVFRNSSGSFTSTSKGLGDIVKSALNATPGYAPGA